MLGTKGDWDIKIINEIARWPGPGDVAIWDLRWAPGWRDLGGLAGSIWLRPSRSGCSGCFDWLDLGVPVGFGRSGWLDLVALKASGR